MFEEIKAQKAIIFENTKYCYETDPALSEAVERSKQAQKFIAGSDTVNVPAARYTNPAKVIVSDLRSLQAAQHYAKRGKKVCVLNFASATRAGGGVVNGATAQEECICRSSTLYPCLNCSEMWDKFYTPHRNANNKLYNDDCIYTPDVCVFKTDEDFPTSLEESERYNVDILTCAAPNLNKKYGDAPQISPTDLKKLLTARIRRIFEIAAEGGSEVLILGAFGCGAFYNPPHLVAEVFNTVMKDFMQHFEVIEYAVFCTPKSRKNFDTFCQKIDHN